MRTTLALTLLLCYLTGLFLAVSGDTPDIGKLTIGCMAENGVSSQDFVDLKSGITKPENVSEHLKCAIHCVVVKLGFMDEDSNILTDHVKEKFASSPMENAVMQALSKCGGIKGTNACDTAFQIMNCLQPITEGARK